MINIFVGVSLTPNIFTFYESFLNMVSGVTLASECPDLKVLTDAMDIKLKHDMFLFSDIVAWRLYVCVKRTKSILLMRRGSCRTLTMKKELREKVKYFPSSKSWYTRNYTAKNKMDSVYSGFMLMILVIPCILLSF